MCNRIATAFNRSSATQTVALDISKAFDRVWYAIFFTNVSLQAEIFGIISSFLSNRLLWVALDGKSSQEYRVNARVPQVVLHFFYCALMTFLLMLFVILLSMQMIPVSSLFVIRHLICGNN